MTDIRVHLDVSGGVGTLRWEPRDVEVDVLQAALEHASRDALTRELRRLEVRVPATDEVTRRALHRVRFRLDGILRGLGQTADGQPQDVAVYSILPGDDIDGPAAFSTVMNTVLPTKRLIGHVLFRDTAGRVLLLETTYKSDWELPGGIVEPGEPPRIGAEREVTEELGLRIPLGAPALIDWLPPFLGWGDAVEFIWDGGVMSEDQVAQICAQEREIRSVNWVEPDAVASHVTPLSARRIALLLEGYRGLTEDGFPVEG